MDQNTCDLMCQHHDMKLLPIYCEDCECPVCTKCLTTSHLKHNICDTSDYVEKQRDELMAAMKGEDSLLEEIRSCLISKRKTLEERKTKLLDEINSREEAIVAVVREVGKHYKSVVSDNVLEWEENIHKGEITLENITKDPEIKTESEIDCIKLLKRYSELRNLQREIKTQDPLNFTFEALKSISNSLIEELFGNINLNVHEDYSHSSDEEKQTEKKSPFEDKNVEKILTRKSKRKDKENKTILHEFVFTEDTMKDFKGIAFCKENTFIHLGNKLFLSTGETCHCDELQNVVFFCGLSSGQGILAITDNWKTLRVFFNNGVCMTFYKADGSNRILAVEENGEGNICMLLVHNKVIYDSLYTNLYTEYSRLYIEEVDENGQTKNISSQKEYQKGYQENAKLITLKNGKTRIAMTCKKSLHVYNKNLATLFIYQQGAHKNHYVKFSASCACVDPEDNILVCNETDNSVHMLDIDGNFLRIVLWPEESSSAISNLSVDKEHWLWLGDSGKEKYSEIRLYDYDYLKRTKRIQRALTKNK